jgi:chorismate synthase
MAESANLVRGGIGSTRRALTIWAHGLVLAESLHTSVVLLGSIPELEELMMNHRFLCDEAARFRTMAEESDREASKVRLLAMAAAYEARAKLASASTEADSAGTIIEPGQAEAAEALTRSDAGEAAKPPPGRKIGTERKESLGENRPIGRLKLRLS